eukprot:720940-Pyramimonas_sp.AAC.1
MFFQAWTDDNSDTPGHTPVQMCLHLRRINSVANDIFYAPENQYEVPDNGFDVNWLNVLACSSLPTDWCQARNGMAKDGPLD